MRLDGKPVLLVFGPQFYKSADWKKVVGKADVATFGVMGDHDGMTGGFGWPSPKASEDESQREISGFYDRAKGWKSFVGIAYPRFHDIYAEARVHASYGRIGDADGATFRKTLALARSKNSPIIQIATWNDYGEGTIIEPTKEFGYRDLEVLRGDAVGKSAMRLPARLFALRKRGVSDKVANPIATALLGGKYDSARRQIELAEKD